MKAWLRRLTPLAGAAFLEGCSFLAGAYSVQFGGPTAHSDYFVVSFVPGTPALAEPGLEALDAAVKEAGRSPPGEIVIEGAAAQGSAEPALEKERTDAVFAAFAKADIDTRKIHTEVRPTTEQGFEERKESLIVQLRYER